MVDCVLKLMYVLLIMMIDDGFVVVICLMFVSGSVCLVGVFGFGNSMLLVLLR